MGTKKRFYSLKDYNGWHDQIIIYDQGHPLGDPQFTPSYEVAKFYLSQASDKYIERTEQYVRELVDLLNKEYEAHEMRESPTISCCCGFCGRERQERTDEGND